MFSAHTEQQTKNMRTKSILLSAAVLAAGVASSMAANVYSVNVVGYVTLTLTNGFNMISNPLDAVGGGTGTGNNLANVFGALPDNTTVYAFSAGSFGQSDLYFNGIGWLSGGTISFNPGQGIFVQIPAGIPGNSTNVTFVGSVVQGPTTNTLPTGFSIVASQPPVAGLITTTLNYQPNNNDTIFVWNPVAQTYSTSFLYFTGPGWLPNEPTLNVGQAIFLQNNSGAPNPWVNNYTVQ
jgi:hypothetical protein